ncbi:hypothetical protein [Empedobacter stercoris]|uniref:hypothetical protein n=1 Tax=Empedobacter stercoris TaxID=1628248 RepID=UPI0039EB7075
MKSIWEAAFENNVIRIENNWFSGEKLVVNGQLQDLKENLFTSELEGHLFTMTKEKLKIKVRLFSDFFRINCILFVDNEQVVLKQIK